MTIRRLQHMIDDVQATPTQQWSLRAGAFAAAVVAYLATEIAVGSFLTVGLVVVMLAGFASLLRTDSHVGLAVFFVVCWRWLASVDDVRTPWSMVVAIALLAFHVCTALTAITPPGGRVPTLTARRWASRSVLVATATIGAWLVMIVLHARSAPGNALLTIVAIALLVVGGLVLRARTVVR
jgi:hypothetical protein